MSIRNIARTLLAGIFIAGGWESVQDPKAKAAAAEEVAPLARQMGLSTDPVDLARINGIVQLAGGLLLAAGWTPRLASLALAGTLVPTTVASHRFWEIQDPAERRAQMTHALKNASILGGLIMTALDHGGRPSVFWTMGRATRQTGRSVSRSARRMAS